MLNINIKSEAKSTVLKDTSVLELLRTSCVKVILRLLKIVSLDTNVLFNVANFTELYTLNNTLKLKRIIPHVTCNSNIINKQSNASRGQK